MIEIFLRNIHETGFGRARQVLVERDRFWSSETGFGRARRVLVERDGVWSSETEFGRAKSEIGRANRRSTAEVELVGRVTPRSSSVEDERLRGRASRRSGDPRSCESEVELGGRVTPRSCESEVG